MTYQSDNELSIIYTFRTLIYIMRGTVILMIPQPVWIKFDYMLENLVKVFLLRDLRSENET
mgnify:CR=1 FL=1